MKNQDIISPNNFYQRVIEATSHGIKTGALHSITTECELIEDSGVEFIVRILENLNRKDKAKKEQKRKQKNKSDGKNFNPFLPYEKDLFVTNLSDTHVCILNKFNVVKNHLLLITREFESQENWLNLNDFTAMAQVLEEIDGLGFYNGGKLAGASQPHKHLQVTPLPLAPNTNKIPFENLILASKTSKNIIISPHFPFVQAIAFFDLTTENSTIEMGEMMLNYYHQLLEKVGIKISGTRQSAAYNLLVTRRWMFIVPREKEFFKNININSLGFAGALLVKNEKQLQTLLEIKPMNLLEKVAIKLK